MEADTANAVPITRNQRQSIWRAFWLALGLFLVACLFPALTFQKGGQPADAWPGWGALLLGWLGLFVGVFAWLANPLLLLSWILLLCGRIRAARVCSLLAILVASSMIALWGMELPGDEGGVTKMQISGIGLGCYLWWACLLQTLGIAWWAVPVRQRDMGVELE